MKELIDNPIDGSSYYITIQLRNLIISSPHIQIIVDHT